MTDDRRLIRHMRGKEQHDVSGILNGVGSSIHSFFNNKASDNLRVAKVTFKSSQAYQHTAANKRV